VIWQTLRLTAEKHAFYTKQYIVERSVKYHQLMPQSVVRNPIAGMYVEIRLGASGCTASPRSGVPPTRKGMPMRRPVRALSDLYRLGSEIVKVMKEALIFGHSVTEKVPEQRATHLGKGGINVQVLLF